MTDRTSKATLLAAFAELERDAGHQQPAWLVGARRAAIDRFARLDLPSTKDEAWKYTSLAPLRQTALDAAIDESATQPAEDEIAAFRIGDGPAYRLIFVNSRYSAKLSAAPPLPGSARLGSLADVLLTDVDALRPYLATSESKADEDAFGALNAAFWRDGAFLQVPAGMRLDAPVELLFIVTAPGFARAHHPRTVVALGPGSEAAVVETHVAIGHGVYLVNATTEVFLGDGAGLEHTTVGLDSPQAFHVGRTRVAQSRDSRFTACSVTFGGRLVRNDVEARLLGDGAACALNGLYVVGGRQHVDTHTLVDHAAPRATSRQLYKGILDGRARGVFDGRVIVRKGSNGTDAHQTNKNLLLSDGVEVDSKPQLEIFADDVKVSHGAADGQVAPEAVFYLKSRGLDEAAAQALLTRGFASEVLGRMRDPVLRTWLEDRLAERLRGGRVADDDAEASAAAPITETT